MVWINHESCSGIKSGKGLQGTGDDTLTFRIHWHNQDWVQGRVLVCRWVSLILLVYSIFVYPHDAAVMMRASALIILNFIFRHWQHPSMTLAWGFCQCCRVWNYKEITKMIMYLLSMHLTMSGEGLVVWTQNWIIIQERDKSILACVKLSVEEEAHYNSSIPHMNIVVDFKAGWRFVLTWIEGYQLQKWWEWRRERCWLKSQTLLK